MRSLFFRSSADRDFQRLPAEMRVRFYRAFAALLQEPARPRAGLDITPLKGHPMYWRLRVGNYRATYTFDAARVIIEEIGKRENFYR